MKSIIVFIINIVFSVLFFFNTIQPINACGGGTVRTPMGRICPEGVCSISDWTIGTRFYPMEMKFGEALEDDLVAFQSGTARVFRSYDHYLTCNFSQSSPGLLFLEAFYPNISACNVTGSNYIGQTNNCTLGVKTEIRWVNQICDSITNSVGTDGGVFVEGVDNWVNVTGLVRPAIGVSLASKIRFVSSSTRHNVRLFKSAAHYAT